MGRVRCRKISTSDYEALNPKNGEVLYFVNDSGTFNPESLENGGRIYLGDKLLTSEATQALILEGGYKVMFNGNDVSNSTNLGYIVASASGNWYGTQSAYNKKVANNTVQLDIAYHIMVQADWNETNPDSLSYIANKPDIMDLEILNTTAKFYYV